MKKQLLLIIASAIFATLVFSGTSYAIGAGVGAGVYIPGGDAADYMDPGLGVNAHVDFGIIPMVDFRIAANYYQSEGEKDRTDYKLSSTGGQALIMVTPPVPIIKPYVGIGYGVYSNSMEITFAGDTKTEDEWGNGFVAQAGIGLSILIVDLGLHGQYFINNADGEDIGGYSVGLGAGLSF